MNHRVTCALLILFTLHACDEGQRGDLVEDPVRLRIAYIPASADLPVFFAQERGLFRDAGLQVELVRANNSSEALSALLASQVDAVGGLTFGVFFPAEVQERGQFWLFQPFAETGDSSMSYLLAHAASGVDAISDLKGRRVGTYTGASQLVYLKLFLSAVGIDPERDVRIVQVGMELQAQALEARQFDALFTVEPYGTITLRTTEARVVSKNPRSKYIMNPFWVGASAIHRRFATAQPTATRKLIAALDEAVRAIAADPAKAKQLLPEYTPLDQQKAEASGLYTWYARPSQEGLKGIQRLADLMAEHDLIDKPLTDVDGLFWSQNAP